VLACVIGTLTLIIAALAVGQVASELRAEASERGARASLAELRTRTRALQERIDEARAARESLAAAREALRARGLDPDAPPARLRSEIESRTAGARLAARAAELEKERDALTASIRLTRDEIAGLEVGGSSEPVTILPRGSGHPLRPFFVECRPEGLRLHRLDEPWSIPLDITTTEGSSRFDAFLNRVRAERHGSVIFLVRPEGVRQYRNAASRAQALAVRYAKLPLPGKGEIQFGAF
jgi:hypothetical protein